MSNQDSTPVRPGKTIVYIPARANSSRLRGKALADLGGHPLISYTIRVARAIRGVDHVLVDTDSPDIRDAAREYGAEVPFLRDPAYAGDRSSLTETARIFHERIREVVGPVARQVSMMPTSPFRNVGVVESLVADLDRYLAVRTVLLADTDLSEHYFVRDGETHSVAELAEYNPVQYDWIKGLGYFHAQYDSSAIPVHLLLYNNFKYHVLTNPVELIDIDHQADLDAARRVVAEAVYDFGMDMR